MSTGRDRTIDALRALAIAGVVLGHWLVTAVVSDPHQPAALHVASPLAYAPELVPVTWFLQTLGLFFFAGGFAAARASAGLASRFGRLLKPVLVLAAVWLAASLLLIAIDAPGGTRRVVWTLVCQPLWFLLVYVVLTALAPWLRVVVVRHGPWAVVPAVAVVAVADACRSYAVAGRLGFLVVPVAWAVPYLLGIALAYGRLPRKAGVLLLSLGVAGGAGLVRLAGYPAGAVGVPGAEWSNLDPPSLFALALAAAQVGTYLLLRPWLARPLQRRVFRAPVAALNLTAMAVYCWHQTALLLVTFAALLAGRPRGLLGVPAGDWIWHRLLWLPVLALTLAGLILLFHDVPRRVNAAWHVRVLRSGRGGIPCRW